ncbi:hypothetical protein ACFR9S_07645, partial [Halolamina salina]
GQPDFPTPDHARQGAVEAIEAGMDLSAAEAVLAEHGLTDASAALSALGYRVEWEGLGGGTVREKDGESAG